MVPWGQGGSLHCPNLTMMGQKNGWPRWSGKAMGTVTSTQNKCPLNTCFFDNLEIGPSGPPWGSEGNFVGGSMGLFPFTGRWNKHFVLGVFEPLPGHGPPMVTIFPPPPHPHGLGCFFYIVELPWFAFNGAELASPGGICHGKFGLFLSKGHFSIAFPNLWKWIQKPGGKQYSRRQHYKLPTFFLSHPYQTHAPKNHHHPKPPSFLDTCFLGQKLHSYVFVPLILPCIPCNCNYWRTCGKTARGPWNMPFTFHQGTSCRGGPVIQSNCLAGSLLNILQFAPWIIFLILLLNPFAYCFGVIPPHPFVVFHHGFQKPGPLLAPQ